MSNKEQMDIISEDGVDVWNIWRAENPGAQIDLSDGQLTNKYLKNANFVNADLSRAEISGADLDGADLRNANLKGAVLRNATFRNATLIGTDLEGAFLQSANLQGANLDRANLRGADLTDAVMNDSQFTAATRGMGRLSQKQRAVIKFLGDTPPLTDSSKQPNRAVTVKYAKSIMGPAHSILQSLAIPNDLTEDHRILFDNLRRTVEELENKLSEQKNENASLSAENKELRDKIGDALPLWRQAWKVFVLGAAGTAGATVGGGAATAGVYTTGYIAGFVAGILHDAFSPGASCLT